MNKLSAIQRAKILRLLCEGMSLRAISRAEDVSLNTVTKLLISAGVACAIRHDNSVRAVTASYVQCDEAWSFVGAKQKNVGMSYRAGDPTAGDCWTWCAIDGPTKLLISYMVGGRDAEFAKIFMDDLRRRIIGRTQITTDGHSAYLSAVENAFGDDVDYAMLIKIYGTDGQSITHERKYSPAECVGTKKTPIIGRPEKKHVSTSYVERFNLTMRMSMRRFTRLTNGYSKKIENHYHAVALHAVYYNYIRQHHSLRVSPAMAAGIETRLWDFPDIVALIEAREELPKRPATYKKRGA